MLLIKLHFERECFLVFLGVDNKIYCMFGIQLCYCVLEFWSGINIVSFIRKLFIWVLVHIDGEVCP